MLPDPHTFDLPRLQAEKRFGVVHYFEELGSTQEETRRLLSGIPLASPVLVIASRQIAGRGRGANRWYSSPGALTFTWATRAESLGIPLNEQAAIALAAALAVVRLLEEFQPAGRFGLKWPNDVYLQGRKLCGVLAESSVGRLLVGIGLNVNNCLEAAPGDIPHRGITLAEALGRPLDLTDTLLAVLERLLDELSALSAGDPEQASAWNDYSLLRGHWLVVDTGREEIQGRCREIGPEGALLLETRLGPRRLMSGEVRQIDPPLR